jgi:DNA (cytosine-5)-methyltransferase 1
MLPRNEIDIIYGGFPCQDISAAGNGIGLEGKRSGLFFEIVRLAKEINPTFVFLENVPAIRTRGLRKILREFANLGYACRWTRISAGEVGACHLRKRWFLLAYTNHNRRWSEQKRQFRVENTPFTWNDGEEKHYPNPNGPRLEGCCRTVSKIPRPAQYNGWTSEPAIRGRNHGISNRMDRIKGLGNAVVPYQAQKAFERLIGIYE